MVSFPAILPYKSVNREGRFTNLISIIIPTFNRRDFLPTAIACAVNQIGVEVEVIVVDDGSIDNTQELIKTQTHPIKYFYQANRGTSAARNLGICKAKGE